MPDAFETAISRFGRDAKAKLNNPAITGAPEDQLRAPLEALFGDLAPLIGLDAQNATLVGETSLSDLHTRPDYAVTRNGALIGFIEVKAPGKGCDPRKFKDPHDKAQWKKLQSLPNLIYTDGNGMSLWRDGKRESEIIHFDGDIETSGASLSASSNLLALLSDFFSWTPIAPKRPRALAETTARLCRLLRDEVTEQLGRGETGLEALKEDWRQLLFPEANNEQFADGYAQAVTFGLLMARARNISLSANLHDVAASLRKTNSLIGAALDLLVADDTENPALKTSLKTLVRVLDVVDWSVISKGDPDAWLYFYEDFLNVYDSHLRKQTGSYYTPPEIVRDMVRLCDDALRHDDVFGLPRGLASTDVTIADPAVGTGTFLLGVLRKIAEIETRESGPGQAPGAVKAAMSRLIGFELQFGPFAVAQLRLLAEIAELTGAKANETLDVDLQLYVADTLGDPDEEMGWIPAKMKPIAESRRAANAIKRDSPITVVIGNPPYKEKARGRGGWVEEGTQGTAGLLARWQPPAEWQVGEHAKHLRNLYVYFWRWAAWKVFGEAAATPGYAGEDKGVIAYITASGFLNGPGFQKMRADLRSKASHIWVIDCTPEGHQPPVASRVFQGVQQPICIVIAARKADTDDARPARTLFRALPEADRKAKFEALSHITLDGEGWTECPASWRAPFLPKGSAAWESYPRLDQIFAYDGSGVMPGRTWVIAPDKASLEQRWSRLQAEKDVETRRMLFHPHEGGDRDIDKSLGDGLEGHEYRAFSIDADTKSCVKPVRYGFRSFDRQWIVPDKRLINRPNPNLWAAYSDRQIFATGWMADPVLSGPALTFTGLIPDLHHYRGNFGGRVFPLWADATASASNFNPALMTELSVALGQSVEAEDLFAYIAALAAHPGYTQRFTRDLRRPGLRIPLSVDAALFDEAAQLGRRVIWLHTFGERCVDAGAGRPAGAPRLETGGPHVPAEGAISDAPDAFPESLEYDAARQRLHLGTGHIDQVTPAMWAYEVSGVNVLKQWFSYRKKDRSRPIIGDRRPPSPLGQIQPDGWLPEYTSELINVLHVLGGLIAMEEAQADLLERILSRPTLSLDTLRAAGAVKEEFE